MTSSEKGLLQGRKLLSVGAAIIITMALLFTVSTTPPAQAQTFTKLYDFGMPGDPAGPGCLLAQGRDGNVYSATYLGGTHGLGAAFKITPTGRMTVLRSFDGIHGANPQGGVILGTDGNFYSTTAGGGAFGLGIVFKMTPDGVVTMMHNFTGGSDLGNPRTPPIQGSDGNLYGETNDSVYKITRDGTFTTFHQFGDGDIYGPLIQAFDGPFYGATNTQLFKMSPDGQVTVLTQSCCFQTTLSQGANGSFYGVRNTDVFTFSPGPFTSLHSFKPGDGVSPIFVPIEATDGNLYGVAGYGGTIGYGTIYRLSPRGEFGVLYNFDGASGAHPWQMLMQHTNGLLYGTASAAGGYGQGTFFSLDIGAAPFIRLVPTSGQIGKNIGILGQGFTGMTSLSFNGIPASFTVSSDTFLETTVPDGALTGSVTAITTSGTLTSNAPFRVTPKLLSFNPTSGAPGTPVVITGSGLTQTLRIGFGGVRATSFSIDSDTQVTAIVPDGAVTGNLAVATQGGHDTAPRTFTVTP